LFQEVNKNEYDTTGEIEKSYSIYQMAILKGSAHSLKWAFNKCILKRICAQKKSLP
jgi:hypothetical protein